MNEEIGVLEKVSVIVPCYNSENTIDRCINSIYEQQCKPQIELIVVNDGSTDLSKLSIERWIPLFDEKGYILKYIEQENQGPGGAINTGLKYVTGKYLSLLDADDCFLQGSIQKRYEFLEINEDFVGVRTNGWQDKNGQRKLFETNPNRLSNTNLFDGLIGGGATNWSGSYMIRTENCLIFTLSEKYMFQDMDNICNCFFLFLIKISLDI